ncbi:multiple sugar transport system substrate-binding protein [Kribbella sp. VKM Ac-2527]|uniref:Multiple sugar transport system substrate-binding protein n=2 Tax=Kribbella caucasensis TaxID=2512215 RepID=A0A4R6KLH3_9ACTN|nr:multiple sugar transport system substrate-binding protein [Kribbella sp. VKM Ac-2527]
MAKNQGLGHVGVSRRGFLGLAGGVAGAAAVSPLLAACSSGAATGSGPLKFWDMPWGGTAYSPAAKRLTEAYQPATGLPTAQYQQIQWANFTQTFSAAVASNTGPAVSTGGGFQAFQFASEGAIAYADHLIDTFKKDGTYDDFLPGTIEAMKTEKGYAAVPWAIDIRVWWYRKSVMDQVGVEPPTTWPELLSTGKKLAAQGYYGFAAGAGAGQPIGGQQMLMMMVNNGGGIFNAGGELDLLNDRNIEAMEFVRELVSNKIIDPRAVGYTIDNVNSQWKNKKFVMGIDTPGLDSILGDTSGDLLVMKPLAGPHGDKACLTFINNIMMYSNTPSQEGSEAFLTYYVKNMKTYWQQNLVPGLPTLKSIVALPEFQKQKNKVDVIQDWQPIGKSFAAQATELTPALAKIDSGQAISSFAQTMFAGRTDAKAALRTFQDALSALIK